MPKVRKKRNKDWRKNASTLAKKIARMKANYKCAYCGQGEPQRRTHGSHIYSEGRHRNMSADVDNILCLCAIHHSVMPGWGVPDWNWHAHPIESGEWFKENYPDLYKKLRKVSQDTMRTIDFEKKYKELKEEYAQLSS